MYVGYLRFMMYMTVQKCLQNKTFEINYLVYWFYTMVCTLCKVVQVEYYNLIGKSTHKLWSTEYYTFKKKNT